MLLEGYFLSEDDKSSSNSNTDSNVTVQNSSEMNAAAKNSPDAARAQAASSEKNKLRDTQKYIEGKAEVKSGAGKIRDAIKEYNRDKADAIKARARAARQSTSNNNKPPQGDSTVLTSSASPYADIFEDYDIMNEDDTNDLISSVDDNGATNPQNSDTDFFIDNDGENKDNAKPTENNILKEKDLNESTSFNFFY
jgi:hypothetical protein